MPIATNVSTAKPKISGAVYSAPIGTPLPTDATTALNEAFVCVGHITEDGIENSQEFDTTQIKAWGGEVVYNSLNEFTDTFQFAMLESKNVNTMKAYYGDNNVSVNGVTGEISVNVKAEDMPERVWVIDMILRGGKARRLVIPDGQVTEREAISYKSDEAVAYGVTVTAIADASSNTHYEYTEGTISTTSYTVLFNSNGGSVVSAQVVASGETATAPDDPTKSGFTFAGWYSDTGLTNAFSFSTAITQDIILYAKWSS